MMKSYLCLGLSLFLFLRGSAQAIPRSGMSPTTNNPSLGITEKKYALRVAVDPLKETLNIRCNENIEYAVVCDMTGHVILSGEGRINTLDISALPSGIYILKLKSFEGHDMAVHFMLFQD